MYKDFGMSNVYLAPQLYVGWLSIANVFFQFYV